MSKPIRTLFPAMLIAAWCLPVFAVAQTDPGSLDDLLGADFAPLQNQAAQQLPELNSPLIMGPQVPRQQEMLPQLESVMEVPRVIIDEPPPSELLLPDLTMPTPENTAMESRENRRSLKPQFEVQPQDRIELLPYGNGAVTEPSRQVFTQPRSFPQSSSFPQPRMQTPQALNYGSQAYSSRSRIQFVPVQVEFYSGSRSFGYQPYGGYRASYSSGYRSGYGSFGRPPVGYRPYGGGDGRYCPYGR